MKKNILKLNPFKILSLITLSIITLFVTACGLEPLSFDNFNSSFPDTKYSSCIDEMSSSYIQYSYTPEKPGFEISNTFKSISLDIDNVKGKSIYIVKENFGNREAYATETGSLNTNEPTSIISPSIKPSSSLLNIIDKDNPYVDEKNSSADFFDFTPDEEMLSRSTVPGDSCIYGYARTTSSGRTYQIGDIETFYSVYDDVNVYAKLVAQTPNGNFWVDSSSYSENDNIKDNKVLGKVNVELLASHWQKDSNDKSSLGIYEFMHNAFGNEYGADNSDGCYGGVDKNPRVNILLYDIGFDNSRRGGVAGFFYAGDLYENIANEKEILYLDAFITDYDTNISVSTLVHEFQHMVNYYHSNMKRRVGMSIAMNEMLSVAAEDLYMEHANIIYPESIRMWLFGSSYYRDSFSVDTWSGSALSYSMAYVLGAFINRNYGDTYSVPLTKKIIEGVRFMRSKDDSKNLIQFATNSNYNSLLRALPAAIIYEDTPNPNPECIATLGAKNFEYENVNLNLNPVRLWSSVLEYENISKSNTPISVLPSTYQVNIPAQSFAIFQSNDWDNIQQDSIVINIETPIDPDVKFFVYVK